MLNSIPINFFGEYTLKSDSILTSTLSPIVSKAITDKRQVDNFINMILKWFDRNNHIMSDTAIQKRPIFSKDDSIAIYAVTNLNEDAIYNLLRESASIKNNWDIMKEEAKSGISSWIAYAFLIRELVKSKREREANIVLMFFTMRIYATLYSKRFLFEPKREVLDYVVANLSNKFDIKRLGSFAKAIKKLADTSHETYLNDLLSNDDKDVLNYITSIRTRLKGFVGNFFNECKIAWASGNYLNTDSLINTKGGEDDFVPERTSDSQTVMGRAQGFGVYFASHRLDETIVLHSARQCDIPFNELLNVLQNTQKDSDPIMQRISAALLTLYLESYRDPELKKVASVHWVPFAVSQFIKTNTNNPAIITIKDNFDKILTRYCRKFTDTKREATKSAYRKALMLFVAVYIQKYIVRP